MKTTKKFTFVETAISDRNDRGFDEVKRISRTLYVDNKPIGTEVFAPQRTREKNSSLSNIAEQINRLSEGLNGYNPSIYKESSPHQSPSLDLYKRFSPTLKDLYSAIRRLLPGDPKHRIYLTATGVHIYVDQSAWSQEKRREFHLRMGDFLSQAAKENISTSTLVVKSTSQCI